MDKQDDLRYDYLLISRADLEIFLGSITKSKPDTSADFLTCYFSADAAVKSIHDSSVQNYMSRSWSSGSLAAQAVESSVAGRAIHRDLESNGGSRSDLR